MDASLNASLGGFSGFRQTGTAALKLDALRLAKAQQAAPAETVQAAQAAGAPGVKPQAPKHSRYRSLAITLRPHKRRKRGGADPAGAKQDKSAPQGAKTAGDGGTHQGISSLSDKSGTGPIKGAAPTPPPPPSNPPRGGRGSGRPPQGGVGG